MFIMDKDSAMTAELLAEFIGQHQTMRVQKYTPLRNLYEGKHKILDAAQKPNGKPDNRLVVNFSKYITDTFNGYFIGVPVKVTAQEERANTYLQRFDTYNNLENHNSELSKMVSMFGSAIELLYMDERGEPCIAAVSPEEAFVVYDDSILHRPKYGVRYYTNTDGELEGSFSDAERVWYFDYEFKVLDSDGEPHNFGGVPLIEYIENEERLGTYEIVRTLIDEYDKAISEKANDVDYFADAYMKVLGAPLDQETINTLRDSRIINIEAQDGMNVEVDFLDKPNADTTQEHLIDRLEKLIFTTSMVININDESNANASGDALRRRMLPMDNLAKVKENKFKAGFQKRYQLITNVPTTPLTENDWLGISYKFTRNTPRNLTEEAETAQKLAGITSEETQLSILSVVDDPMQEIQRKREELEAGDPYMQMVLQQEPEQRPEE